MSGKFECLQCGHCCLYAGSTLHIEQSDIERWEKEGRYDIIDKVFLVRFECTKCNIQWGASSGNICSECGQVGLGIFYWIDSNQPLNYFAQLLADPRCPFLKKVRNKDKYVCKIHDTKPKICEEFPDLDKEQKTKNEGECIEWGCKGYEKWKSSNSS